MLQVWQGHVAFLLTIVIQWLTPFRGIDLINTRWRPTIDQVADVVVVALIVALMHRYHQGKGPTYSSKHLFWWASGALVLGLICYAMQADLIHRVDPDLLWIANIPWAFSYVGMFSCLGMALFVLMTMVRDTATTRAAHEDGKGSNNRGSR